MMCEETDRLTAGAGWGSANVEITSLYYVQYVFPVTFNSGPGLRKII